MFCVIGRPSTEFVLVSLCETPNTGKVGLEELYEVECCFAIKILEQSLGILGLKIWDSLGFFSFSIANALTRIRGFPHAEWR